LDLTPRLFLGCIIFGVGDEIRFSSSTSFFSKK
jgi:hypothetical protein